MGDGNIYQPNLRSQWDCLLANLGAWQGAFTSFSPQGELLEDTPTLVSLQGVNDIDIHPASRGRRIPKIVSLK